MTQRDDERKEIDRPGDRRPGRPGRRWSRPKLTDLGHLRDLVRGGGGKLSAQFDGDGRKPNGSG